MLKIRLALLALFLLGAHVNRFLFGVGALFFSILPFSFGAEASEERAPASKRGPQTEGHKELHFDARLSPLVEASINSGKRKVIIMGEVVRPGALNLSDGEVTLRRVLGLAGGFTKDAYPSAAILLRNSALAQSQHKVSIECLPRPEQAALLLSLLIVDARWAKHISSGLISHALKRIPVMIEPVAKSSQYGVETLLQDGDLLLIPARARWVIVDGAVRDPGFRAFETGLLAEDYIAQSGGRLSSADSASLIYPDGRVIPLQIDPWNYQPTAVPPASVIVVDKRRRELECVAGS